MVNWRCFSLYKNSFIEKQKKAEIYAGVSKVLGNSILARASSHFGQSRVPGIAGRAPGAAGVVKQAKRRSTTRPATHPRQARPPRPTTGGDVRSAPGCMTGYWREGRPPLRHLRATCVRENYTVTPAAAARSRRADVQTHARGAPVPRHQAADLCKACTLSPLPVFTHSLDAAADALRACERSTR